MKLIKPIKTFLEASFFLFISYFFFLPVGQAQVFPTDLTELQQQKLDDFVLGYIKEMREKELQPQPDLVSKFNEEYAAQCLERAQSEYEKHRQWFYCEGKNGYWSETVTYRVYWQLIQNSGRIENIPGYTPEKHQAAIKFWQSWQQKDGSFKNPISPDREVNQKYITPPNLMSLLGCNPLYETSGYGADEIDVDYYLEKSAEGKLNDAMARAAVLFTKIHEGQLEYIPILERGIELALTYMNPNNGMLIGKDINPKGAEWSGYNATVETMKGLGRLLGYMGIENFPYHNIRTDAVLKNQEYFRQAHVSVIRNTAEMYMQCLFESSYREKELLDAMKANAEALLKEAKWNVPIEEAGGDYTAYGLMLAGPYLHWQGYENSAPRTPFYQGAAHDWRVVIGPFGHCANVIRKSQEELLWNKDWNYETYGLRPRNEAYQNATIVDVLPASSEQWTKTEDKEGRTILSRKFILNEKHLENPYLKIKWTGGDIQIFVNNIQVGKKRGNLDEYGGIYINPEAAQSLKKGENTISIRSAGKTSDGELKADAGLIDWKIPFKSRKH